MIELTALLTIYNRANLLHRVLRSVESQTLPKESFELVIIDDGSTDNSRDIIDQFASRLPIRYCFQENAGLAAARNHGLDVAQAPIIVMMDDDDILLPRNLEEHLKTHKEHPEKEAAVLGYTSLDESVRCDPLMHYVTEVCGYLFSYKHIDCTKAHGFDMFWGGRTSFKTEFVKEAGCFNPVFRFGCEDIELAYRLSKRGLKVFYNPKAESAMIRSITLSAFCNRLRRQGQSQAVFSTLWPEREAIEWCQIESFEREWPHISPYAEFHMKRATTLDRWVRDSLSERAEIEPLTIDLLHQAYHDVFKASKLAGIAEGLEAGHKEPAAQTSLV